MYSEDYIYKMSLNFFGEYWDDGIKSETLCFRVSKDIKNYFVKHANGCYGNTQKAMEKIFKDYMESIVYKRGKVNNIMVLLIPKFNSKKELDEISYHDIIEFDDDGSWHYNHLGDFNIRLEDNLEKDVVVESFYDAKGILDWDKEYFDDYFNFEQMEITIDDYIVIPFYFNNYLDLFKDGVYQSKSGEGHEGLIISEYNSIKFYIYLQFDNHNHPYITLISDKEAYRIAVEVDNIPLANIIASFNEDINSIESEVNTLKNRKKDLENQLKSINHQLKNLDK